MNKVSKRFFLISFLIGISLLILINTSIGGYLQHTIFSPYDIVITDSKVDYVSSVTESTSEVSIGDGFKLLEEYQGEQPSEPFCMIGGQYKVEVINDASPAVKGKTDTIPILYNKTFNLYYCKTLKDILEKIKIPSSWKNDNLLVYCNDGSNLNHQPSNFDYITSQINTYKACVVTNRDLDNSNVIIFGFDVGNQVVDNDNKYFFNTSNFKGPVLNQLNYVETLSTSTNKFETYQNTVTIPYNSETIENTQNNNNGLSGKDAYDAQNNDHILDGEGNNNDGKSGNNDNNQQTIYTAKTEEEAKEYLISEGYSENINIIHIRNEPKTPESDSYSVYTVYKDLEFSTEKILYNSTKSDSDFFFIYEEKDAFYSLSNSGEDFDYDLNKIFEFDKLSDLSRIVFLKQINSDPENYQIYGYEKAESLIDGIESNKINPVYIINLKDFNDYDSNICENTLKRFGTLNGDYNDGINCNGKTISIVSKTINTKEKDDKFSFHLFKNIMTNIGN